MRFLNRVWRALAWRWKYRFRASRYYAFINLCKGLPVRGDGFFPIQKRIIKQALALRMKMPVMNHPKEITTVSVVIPHYNQQVYLGQTIRSIQAQTYPAHEILVVDDMSSDIAKVQEVENDFRNDSRVRFIYSREKLYTGGARQMGSDEASGDAILFIDSDDLMPRQRLELSIQFMNNHHDCAFLVSGYIPFSDSPPEEEHMDSSITEATAKRPHELTKKLARYFSIMRLSWIDPKTGKVPWYAWGNFGVKSKYPSANGSIMIRKEAASVLRWSNPKAFVFTPYEDYEYCLLAHAATEGGYQIDAPLTYYRKGSTTNDPAGSVSS